MRLKVALMGLLASVAVAFPVVAQGVHFNNHPIGTSVAFYFNSNTPPEGLFAHWTSNHGWLLTFGDNYVGTNESDFVVAGLRIDAPSGQPANSFQFDVDTTGHNLPFIEVWAVKPGATGPSLLVDAPLFALGSSTGFTFTDLHNGFTRVFFKASGNSNFAPKTAFSSIYFADSTFGNSWIGAFTDKISNGIVNHAGVVPNVQPFPEFDSTLDFL